MPADLAMTSLREAARLIAARKLSPVDLTAACLERVATLNDSLGALITVTAETARQAALAAERRLRPKGRPQGALHGIPLTIKDLILTREAPTTAGSKVFGAGLPAGRDAPVVERLRRAGAIVLGKANLHEIALGVTSVNEHFGPARNPRDPTRISGGSSGGSAVAVATGMGLGSLGTDTRGSIRIPAACCGIVGLKPTFGLIATEDVVPLAPTLDHVGPMARSVEDVAVLLGAMSGRRRLAAQYLRAVDRKPRRMTIAVSEYFLRDVDAEVGAVVERALRALARAKHKIVQVEIPELEDALEASRVIVLAEAIGFHDAHLKANPGGYGPLVRSRLEGAYQLSALQLIQAEEKRALLVAAYAALFREVDVLLSPTLPTVAPAIETQSVRLGGREMSIAEAFCRFNAPQNLTGVPSLSLPAGSSKGGLPIGLQLSAGLGRDDTVLALGEEYGRIEG